MKRALVTLMVGLTILVGTALPAKADRVRCNVPSGHRVVCYNFTPYQVRLRLNIFTDYGVRTRYFTIRGNQYTVYSSAWINRITWRWWWA